jgi:hypothetical protein
MNVRSNRSKRSPDECSDIRVFVFAMIPAYRCAHAGYLLTRPTGCDIRGLIERKPILPAAYLKVSAACPAKSEAG